MSFHRGGGGNLAPHKAFTLAEVLITLGIIGIIAALTIPNLVANYQNKVAVVRLQKAYSLFMQFETTLNADGGYATAMLTKANDADMIEEFFNLNFKPHFNITEVKKLTKGLAFALPDGSGVYLMKLYATAGKPPMHDTHAIFCVDYKNCKNIDENSTIANMVNGKSIFQFWLGSPVGLFPTDEVFTTREEILAECQRLSTRCARLIQFDGWEIKDDFPR